MVLNMDMPADFYLAPYDPEQTFKPKDCLIEHRLAAHNRDDFLLVKVNPPFEYENGTVLVDEVVLGVRFQGDTLFPINNWPMHVHICNILNHQNIMNGKVTAKDLTITYWGLLYQNIDQII